jgi:hypothetical protein
VVCHRAKTDRKGFAMHPLGVLEYPWEIVGIDYIIDLPKSDGHSYTNILL